MEISTWTKEALLLAVCLLARGITLRVLCAARDDQTRKRQLNNSTNASFAFQPSSRPFDNFRPLFQQLSEGLPSRFNQFGAGGFRAAAAEWRLGCVLKVKLYLLRGPFATQ